MQAKMNFRKRLNLFVFCTLTSHVGSSSHAFLVVLSVSTIAALFAAWTGSLELSVVDNTSMLKQ